MYSRKKIETLSPNLLSFVVARMCSIIDYGEKGYKLPEQILLNFLALFPTLNRELNILSDRLVEQGIGLGTPGYKASDLSTTVHWLLNIC